VVAEPLQFIVSVVSAGAPCTSLCAVYAVHRPDFSGGPMYESLCCICCASTRMMSVRSSFRGRQGGFAAVGRRRLSTCATGVLFPRHRQGVYGDQGPPIARLISAIGKASTLPCPRPAISVTHRCPCRCWTVRMCQRASSLARAFAIAHQVPVCRCSS